MAFWDSSAIVPLCIHQPASGRIRRLLAEHRRPVVWWGTPVEVRSALARLMREGTINGTALAQALRRLDTLRRSWAEMIPNERIRAMAEQLPERYDLRASDAFQLAAALAWCSGRPRGRPFITIDRRLAAAASGIGFHSLVA